MKPLPRTTPPVELTVSGWGRTDDGSYPDLLQKAKVPFVGNNVEKCKFKEALERYKGGYNLTDTELESIMKSLICAGGKNNTSRSTERPGTCEDDLGGSIIGKLKDKYNI